jgi:uncharacterized membrane protein
VRRTFGYILFILGFVLIFLAPLLHFYAAPRVEKAPTDVYDTSISEGRGFYFTAKGFKLVGPVALRNVQIAKGDPEKSTHEVAVINLFSRTADLTNGGDIQYSNDVYVMDRTTGYAVHCCGEKPRHDGVTLKFPFYVEKRTYPFWDGTSGRAWPARYAGEDTVEGLKVYRFVQTIPSTLVGSITIPGFLAGSSEPNVIAFQYYQATTTLYVEPVTGAIVKGGQHAVQYVTDSSGASLGTIQDTNLVNTDQTVRKTVAPIKTKAGQLKLVRYQLPIAGPIIGIVLIVVGLLLLRSPRPVRPATETRTVEAVA